MWLYVFILALFKSSSCFMALWWDSIPPKTHNMINSPLILWLIVILHNYVLLFYSTLTLIPFISLPPDIASNYDFIVYSLSIGSLSLGLSKGRHRIKTRDRSPKWLFICLLSGLTLLWWLCACVCVRKCMFPFCILCVVKMRLGACVCRLKRKCLCMFTNLREQR